MSDACPCPAPLPPGLLRGRARVAVALATVAAAAAATALLAACSPPAAPPWAGYAEGDYLRIAAPLGGTLAQLPVAAGQAVAAGALLFALEAEAETAAQAEAQARAQAATAQARNTEQGRRPDELAVTQAQREQALAQRALARSELARTQALREQGFVSPARVDDVRAAVQQAEARVAELEAALRVARLPAGREDERRAARASASAADELARQQRWRLQQKQQQAPVAAQVADVYYRVGEWVAAGQPVLALLPPGAVKARFYVREDELAALHPGDAVQVWCDGCPAPQAARIAQIATQPEYTPPVIYSNAQRARLLYRVEAFGPPGQPLQLKPGQPIDVRRAGP